MGGDIGQGESDKALGEGEMGNGVVRNGFIKAGKVKGKNENEMA